MKIVIVSGFFNPLHGGHLNLIEGAAELGEKLVVIVNNDVQQMMKKDKIILPQENRARLMGAIKHVDEVMIAVDQDSTVTESLKMIAEKYPNDELIFANGGDRDSPTVTPEAGICEEYGIATIYGVGGSEKADSSTRINQALGHKK